MFSLLVVIEKTFSFGRYGNDRYEKNCCLFFLHITIYKKGEIVFLCDSSPLQKKGEVNFLMVFFSDIKLFAKSVKVSKSILELTLHV